MARKTTEEILAAQPWAAGRPAETICGVYYGDLPSHILRTTYLCGKYSPNEAVDVYIAKLYAPTPVEAYCSCNSDGYKLQGGPILTGNLSIRYGGGEKPYQLVLFNHYGKLDIHGFCLYKCDAVQWGDAAEWAVEVHTPGWPRSLIPPIYRRGGIDPERIDAIFRRAETSDEYGLFDRAMVQTARQIWAELGLEGLE